MLQVHAVHKKQVGRTQRHHLLRRHLVRVGGRIGGQQTREAKCGLGFGRVRTGVRYLSCGVGFGERKLGVCGIAARDLGDEVANLGGGRNHFHIRFSGTRGQILVSPTTS